MMQWNSILQRLGIRAASKPSEQPVMVFVVIRHANWSTTFEGVFGTKARALKFLEEQAEAQGATLIEGAAGTYDIGPIWYTIEAHDVG